MRVCAPPSVARVCSMPDLLSHLTIALLVSPRRAGSVYIIALSSSAFELARTRCPFVVALRTPPSCLYLSASLSSLLLLSALSFAAFRCVFRPLSIAVPGATDGPLSTGLVAPSLCPPFVPPLLPRRYLAPFSPLSSLRLLLFDNSLSLVPRLSFVLRILRTAVQRWSQYTRRTRVRPSYSRPLPLHRCHCSLPAVDVHPSPHSCICPHVHPATLVENSNCSPAGIVSSIDASASLVCLPPAGCARFRCSICPLP